MSTAEPLSLHVRIDPGPGADVREIEEGVRSLRREIAGLHVESVEFVSAGRAPAGTRSPEAVLAGSLFEIPPGYKETSMFGAFAQTPEQAKQMEDAQKQLEGAMKNMTPEQRKMMEEMMKKQGAPPPKQ